MGPVFLLILSSILHRPYSAAVKARTSVQNWCLSHTKNQVFRFFWFCWHSFFFFKRGRIGELPCWTSKTAHSARLQQLILMFSLFKFLVYQQSYFTGRPHKQSFRTYVLFCFFFQYIKKKQRSMIQINGMFKSSTVYWAPSVNISAISVYLEGCCPGHYLLPAWQYHQLRRVRRGLFFVF